MHEPQVAYENCEYIYYHSPNVTVENNEESSLFEEPVIYPENIKTQVFKNLPQNIIELENNLWTQVKSGKLSVDSKAQDKKIYTEFCVLVAGVTVVAVFKLISNAKKKKEQDLTQLYD